MKAKIHFVIEVVADIVGDEDILGIERAIDRHLRGQILSYRREDLESKPEEKFVTVAAKLNFNQPVEY